MLRVSSETVKTFDVCGKKSPVSCIEETSNVQPAFANYGAAGAQLRRIASRRPTFNFKLYGSLRQISIILDRVVDMKMIGRS
jgi:hypothetical protein